MFETLLKVTESLCIFSRACSVIIFHIKQGMYIKTIFTFSALLFNVIKDNNPRSLLISCCFDWVSKLRFRFLYTKLLSWRVLQHLLVFRCMNWTPCIYIYCVCLWVCTCVCASTHFIILWRTKSSIKEKTLFSDFFI